MEELINSSVYKNPIFSFQHQLVLKLEFVPTDALANVTKPNNLVVL